MSIFDADIIERDFLVKDFYTLEVVNLGMSKDLEDEAKKMFKVSFDQIQQEFLNTPLKRFERLFFNFDPMKIKKPNGFYMYIDLEWVRTLMLKWFLRKWVKKEYRSGYNAPHCNSNIRYADESKSTRYINIYNGEVIEWSSGANMMFMFRPK